MNKRPERRLARAPAFTTAVALLITVGVSACGDGDDARVQEAGAEEVRPFATVELRKCPVDYEAGGFDVKVSGVSCKEANSGLVLSLGNPFGGYNHPQERVYQSNKEEAAGWTCWARFEGPEEVTIRHACWRGDQVLLFKAG